MKDTSVGLKYIPPKDDGGAEIFNYIIEYRVDGGFKWLRSSQDVSTDLVHTVQGLIEGNMYEFRVAAENKAGVGPFSDPTLPVKAKEPLCKHQSRNTNTPQDFLFYFILFLCFFTSQD